MSVHPGAEKQIRGPLSRGAAAARQAMARTFREVRAATTRLCQPLEAEDFGIQAGPEVSPPKWHLAHTSWYFESRVVAPNQSHYLPYHPRFACLFGDPDPAAARHPRELRGLLSRPTLEEVYRYRAHVDSHVMQLVQTSSDALWEQIEPWLLLGLHHERKHQERLLVDLKLSLWRNPLAPPYRAGPAPAGAPAPPLAWVEYEPGPSEIGADPDAFAFACERPRHSVTLAGYRFASRPVTNAGYLEFVEAGGYATPDSWLAEGWACARRRGWVAPLYWERIEGQWWEFSLGGIRPLPPDEPVSHVSFYEADAYARWAGLRLPTEAEWEHAAVDVERTGNLLEADRLHPDTAPADSLVASQLFGDVWEWTSSPYLPYPGYCGDSRRFSAARRVLRGGSCVTPAALVRGSYRHSLPPDARWHVTGIRLATDAGP